MQNKNKRKVRGEHLLFFIACIVPLFMLFMTFSVDIGGFLLMRTMTRTYSDVSAVAAAQAVDISDAGGTYLNAWNLHPRWAKDRAYDAFNMSIANMPRSPLTVRMQFGIGTVNVSGNEATVSVVGRYTTIWSKGEYETVAVTKKKFNTSYDPSY